MTTAPHPTGASAAPGVDRALTGVGLAAALSALLGVSCCVVPIGFTLLGLGGAWLSYLAIFATVGPYLLGGASIAVAAGWWLAVHRWPGTIAFGALGVATIALTLAILIRLHELELNRYLLDIWRAQ